MALSLLNFNTLVQRMAAASQGACAQLLDLTVGSILRSITEASASVALWLQWLLVLVYQRERLATSSGVDVDSFVGDFDLARLPADFATGVVTISRFYASSVATVLPGSNVRTGDGSQTYTITTDATHSLWNTLAGGYVIPISTASAIVPIVALVAGAGANVSAGAISLLASAIPGIDTVTNAAAITNGADAETDDELKARFVNYISSLSKATRAAISAAVAGVQQGLTFAINPNVDGSGDVLMGNFVVVVDDGSGDPSDELLAAIAAAITPVKALCESFNVMAPEVVDASVVLTITVASGYVKANLLGPVADAITAYINALAIGADLPFSRISQIAYGVSAGITNVSSVTINSGTADISATSLQVIRTSSVVVN